MPKGLLVGREDKQLRTRAVSAIVLAFPARDGDATSAASDKRSESAAKLPAIPSRGDRPTLIAPALREWLRTALIVSLAVHAVIFAAFQLRFEDDLERAAGAAALASNGSATIEIEIVSTAALPSAPSPSDASENEAAKPTPVTPQPEAAPEPEREIARAELEKMIPLPEPTPVLPPLSASAANEASQVALPEEESTPPLPVATANAPEAPAAEAIVEESPPLPIARRPPPEPEPRKPVERREEKQTARASPSTAASPSQAAGANSAGHAGAGGLADAGGRAAVSSYQAQVLAHLARYRVYPPEARSRGVTGVARVQFVLARDGRVLSVRLVGGSGERILDDAGVAMVRRASPFPAFPPALTQASMNFGAPIRFDLR
ncbi:MAG: TonB family protein [Bradyrhizobiaceae bacterium]|nr:TonB family protein [Bradyrhizobiaceae bacterium]